MNDPVPTVAPVAVQQLRRVRLVADDALDTSVLEREFCTVVTECANACAGDDVIVDDVAWRGAFDLGRFDESVDRALALLPDPVVAIRGDDAAAVACQVVSRYQRFVRRRNAASSTRVFDAALEAHASLHDLSDPQSRAVFEYGLDTWQWMLRLDAQASLAPQLAALLHEVVCADDSNDDRLDHRATGHPLTEATRARGGQLAFELVRRIGASESEATRVRDIVRRHERDSDSLLLDDADALSFLSLRSSRYADHFGVAQTRRKMAYTVSRLGPLARAKLAFVRLRPDVERLLHGGAS
jgi:hypothetical protein